MAKSLEKKFLTQRGVSTDILFNISPVNYILVSSTSTSDYKVGNEANTLLLTKAESLVILKEQF